MLLLIDAGSRSAGFGAAPHLGALLGTVSATPGHRTSAITHSPSWKHRARKLICLQSTGITADRSATADQRDHHRVNNPPRLEGKLARERSVVPGRDSDRADVLSRAFCHF